MQVVSHSPEGAEQTHIQPLRGCHYPLSLPPPAAPAVIQIKVLRTFSTHHQCDSVNNHITNNPILYSGALHLSKFTIINFTINITPRCGLPFGFLKQ
jgi:hypothetical protein